MATSTVSAVANTITQQKSVTQASTASNNTIASNVKNALFGTGSLSASDVHISSVNADISNALKVDPKNANLIAAQKNMAAAQAAKDATSKAANLTAAQKSLQAILGVSSTPKTTTPTTTTTKTTTPTTTKTTTPTTTTPATTKTTTPATTKTTTPTTPVTTTTSSPTSMVATTTPATSVPPVSTGATTSAVGTYNPTVLTNVKNALFGTGSLGVSDVHISSVNADIANALKVMPKDSNLLAAQAAMKGITNSSSSSAKTAAFKTAQTALTAIYNTSKSGKPTPTPNKPAPTPTPTPTPTPVISDTGTSIESSIRNSLFGKGSFETTALDYTTVNKNITSALQLISTVPATNIVGNTTPTQWQQVNSSLVSAKNNMAAALGNKGTDDAAGKARSEAFVSAKSDLSKAETLMNALGYTKKTL